MNHEPRETLLARLRQGPDFLQVDPDRPRPTWRQRARTLSRTGLSIVEDIAFDAFYGLDTRRRVESSELGPVVGDNTDQACHYSATRGRHLERLFDHLQLPAGLGLLDVGAGKGLVLLRASRRGFTRLVGIESAASLLEVGQQNLARFRARTGRGHNISLVLADAALWRIPDDLHVVYLFNPFGPRVFQAFLDRLHESCGRRARPIWLIVNKAQHDEPITAPGLLRATGRFRYGSSDVRIYQNAESIEMAGEVRSEPAQVCPTAGQP